MDHVGLYMAVWTAVMALLWLFIVYRGWYREKNSSVSNRLSRAKRESLRRAAYKRSISSSALIMIWGLGMFMIVCKPSDDRILIGVFTLIVIVTYVVGMLKM